MRQLGWRLTLTSCCDLNKGKIMYMSEVLVQLRVQAIMVQHQWSLVQQKYGEIMVVRMSQEGAGMGGKTAGMVVIIAKMVGFKTIGLVNIMELLPVVVLCNKEACLKLSVLNVDSLVILSVIVVPKPRLLLQLQMSNVLLKVVDLAMVFMLVICSRRLDSQESNLILL